MKPEPCILYRIKPKDKTKLKTMGPFTVYDGDVPTVEFKKNSLGSVDFGQGLYFRNGFRVTGNRRGVEFVIRTEKGMETR